MLDARKKTRQKRIASLSGEPHTAWSNGMGAHSLSDTGVTVREPAAAPAPRGGAGGGPRGGSVHALGRSHGSLAPHTAGWYSY